MSLPTSNPCLFVVGCPRSGTTLLQRMLDSHPELAVANDTSFAYKAIKAVVPDWKKQIRLGAYLPLTPELVEYVRTYKRFKRLGLTSEQVDAAAAAETYSGFVSRLYTEFARRNGKRLAGEKTPDFVRRMPTLHSMFPAARFLHIIRDGRDVVLSATEWAAPGNGPRRFGLFEEEPVATTALWWCWQVATGRRDGRELGDAYKEIRYEQLVEYTEATLREVCEFMSLPFDAAMLHYHEGKASYEPKSSAKSAWLPPTRGLRDWRNQMSSDDQHLFEALAGELLDELGYERSHASPTAEVAARAERCRRWWHSQEARV